MHGEGVRHPTTSIRKRLPPFMYSWCLIKQMLDLLGTNVLALLGVHQLVKHVFRCDRFCYHLFPFDYLLGFSMKQWLGALKTLTLFTITKSIGLAMIKISFTLRLQGKSGSSYGGLD
jgi:hypothetical protein